MKEKFYKGRTKLICYISIVTFIVLGSITLIIDVYLSIELDRILLSQLNLLANAYTSDDESKLYQIRPFIEVVVEDDNTYIKRETMGNIKDTDIYFLMDNIEKVNNYKYSINNFYFTKINDDKKEVYFIIDGSLEANNFNNIVLYTNIITLSAWLLVTLSSIFIAKKAFEPYEKLYVKEKNFVTNASHELKTPLAVIQTNLEVMELEENNNQWIKSSKEQIKRLSTLINEMVLLSKVEELGKDVKKEKFNLSQVLEKSMLPYSSLILKNQITMEVDIQKNVYIYANQQDILKLFSILLDNMMRYTSGKKDAKITLKEIEGEVIIDFYNSVKFIDVESCSKIFDRFYTVEQSHEKGLSGSGIGLAIAKEIVFNNNGNITATTNKKSIDIQIVFKTPIKE